MTTPLLWCCHGSSDLLGIPWISSTSLQNCTKHGMGKSFLASLGPSLRYGFVGAITCVLAVLVAEIFVQALNPTTVDRESEQPIAIALLIDTSGSMQSDEKILKVQEASVEFLRGRTLNSYIAVVPFSNSARILSPILEPGQSVDLLAEDIRRLRAGGLTAMADSLIQANNVFDEILGGPQDATRQMYKAIMLFTDGFPEGNVEANETREEAKKRARNETVQQAALLRRKGVAIFAVGTESADSFLLRRLTGSSRRVFKVGSGDFVQVFTQVGAAIAAGAFGTATTWQGLIIVGMVALYLGIALLAAENVWGLRGPWWRDLWWMPALSLALGLMGGAVGEYFIGVGVVTWSLVGLSCGIALGITDLFGESRTGPTQKTWRGALFGLVGGLVGGFLFMGFFTGASGEATDSGSTLLSARMAGFAVLGFCVGLAIKMGEEIFKDAWIMGVTKGFYEGKQYVLSKPQVTVGKSGKDDINLHREPHLDGRAGRFVLDGGAWFFQPTNLGLSAVAVNGSGVLGRVPLVDGTAIRLGGTEFLFRHRSSQTESARDMNWVLVGDTETFEIPYLDEISIGSDYMSDIVINAPSVASLHCNLVFTAHGLQLRTQGGSPVTVNDESLVASDVRTLQRGDLIILGDVEFALMTRS